MDDSFQIEIKRAIQEINLKVDKIQGALIGSLENDTVGLIEKNRVLRVEVDSLLEINKINIIKIKELEVFKSDAKKVVAGIALAIPILFEFFKLFASAIWEYFRSSK